MLLSLQILWSKISTANPQTHFRCKNNGGRCYILNLREIFAYNSELQEEILATLSTNFLISSCFTIKSFSKKHYLSQSTRRAQRKNILIKNDNRFSQRVLRKTNYF